MSGSVPAQESTPKDAGGKKVSDFISADTRIRSSGVVTGTLHYVTGVTSFSKEEQDGYFIPVTLDSKYQGKPITVTGKTTTTAEDTEWLLRVSEDKTPFTFATDESNVFLTLNFDSATLGSPVGKEAVTDFASVKADFGRFGNTADFWDKAPTVEWDGTTGKVTGTLKSYAGSAERLEKGAYYLPIVMTGWFSGKKVSVYCKNEREPQADMDWVIKLTDNTTPITVKYNDAVVAKLDLTGLTLTPKGD